MLTQPYEVIHNEREELGRGLVVGGTLITSKQELLTDKGQKINDANGNPLIGDMQVPFMLVLWENAREISPSFHKPEELTHLLDFDEDEEDDEEEDEEEVETEEETEEEAEPTDNDETTTN